MKNKLFSSAVLLLTCIYSLGAQEKPDVGFSMGLHMGPVISKDISKRGQTLATVAKDHTLMIWGYPSYDFRKAINLPGDNISPVSYGVCAIIPTNPNIVLIADNTGDVYENDLYKRRIKKKDNGVRPINDDREGLFYDNAAESITTRYSFIAVDVEQGKVIDRVGSLSSKIADFVFSPDESFLLVVSNGEEAVLYDTWGLRQVSQFLFEDERILGARFLNKEELCFFTDINYYNGVIKGYDNSTAQMYAGNYNRNFVMIENQPVILGDANGDGNLDITDATCIQRHLAEFPVYEYIEEASDTDGDGQVSILDVTMIQRYLAQLPCPEGIGEVIK